MTAPKSAGPEQLSNDPLFDLLYEEHETVDQIARLVGDRGAPWHKTLRIGSILDLRRPKSSADFLERFYGVADGRALREVMDDSFQHRNSDLALWDELQLQARCKFDENLMRRHRTGSIFLRDLPAMSRPGQVFGGVLAVRALFGPSLLESARSNSNELALQKMIGVIPIDEIDLTHIIRATAIQDKRSKSRQRLNESDGLLLEACKEPNGLVRRALSDGHGVIDLSYFRNDQVLEQNAMRAFDALVAYDDKKSGSQPEDYAALKSVFPEGFEIIENDPVFLTNAYYMLHKRICEFAADGRVPEAQGSLLPPAQVFDVVPREAVASIAEGIIRETEQWLPTARALDTPGSTVNAMLRSIGPEDVVRRQAAARRGIRRITESLVMLEAEA